jgi:hypothetical protein
VRPTASRSIAVLCGAVGLTGAALAQQQPQPQPDRSKPYAYVPNPSPPFEKMRLNRTFESPAVTTPAP